MTPFSEYIFREEFMNFKILIEKVMNSLEKLVRSKNNSQKTKKDQLDRLLILRKEYLQIGKFSEHELSLKNITLLIHDVFIAGIETTFTTMEWIFIYMFTLEDVELKLRNEVKNVLGERKPCSDDMMHCNYFMAFIFEVIRIRSIVKFGLPHKLLEEYEIGKIF